MSTVHTLDAYDVIPENPPAIEHERDRKVRRALGQCLAYAGRIDLASMTPRQDLTSTEFCLAHPGHEYLIFAPAGTPFTVDLRGDATGFSVEWLNIETGEVSLERDLSPSANATLTPPFPDAAVAYLKRRSLNT